LGLRRQLQPVVEGAALVGLKVTPGDVPQLGRVDQLADRLAHGGKHGLQAGMKEKRLLVAHEEMIELHVDVRDVHGQPKKVGRDFVDSGGGHDAV
jgi:hypothetical protein